MIVDDYINYYKNYRKKYGLKTVVLMEVGSFFEIYGVDNEKEKIGNIKEITEILNITLSKKNKNIINNSRKNCLMAGFPSPALQKFLPVLLQNSYTVVLIEQTTPPPNPKREITNVFSPGTYINEIYNKSPRDDNNISAIYLDSETDYKTGKLFLFVGLSSIDLSTGKCSVHEIINNKEYCLENLFQYIEANDPKELLIINQTDIKINDLFNHRKIYSIEFDKAKNKITYLNEFFKKIYIPVGLLSSLEHLDIERKLYAANSFMYLLNFAYDHNEEIIKRIHKPDVWNDENKLTLYNNSLYQLNICNKSNSVNSNNNVLINILDKTSTPMGRRLLRKHIIQPNIKNLQSYYDYIEKFKSHIKELEEPLQNIIDIERLKRRILLKTIHPHELYNFYLSILYCEKLFDIIKDFYVIDSDISSIKTFITYCEHTYNLEELNKYSLNDIKKSIFNKEIYPEVDIVQKQIDTIHTYFNDDINKLCHKLSRKLLKKSKKTN